MTTIRISNDNSECIIDENGITIFSGEKITLRT